MVFFFRAEDGIRVIGVTGVQTCALPICRASDARQAFGKSIFPNAWRASLARRLLATGWFTRHIVINRWFLHRSEERRVGKECTTRETTIRQKRRRAAGNVPLPTSSTVCE